MKREKVELLAPAGSFEAFTATIHAGADAVYVGGRKFGARAYADNFEEEELIRAIDYAHIHGRKLYLTINTLLKNKEIQELYSYLEPYYREGLDAVILQDIGVLHFIKKQFPDLPVHASTQMTITGVEGARFMEQLGIERVVTARELSLEEIAQIHKETKVEIESFIHGALCYSYSGQCLLSSMLGGRSGNRGRCAQPCRLPFDVTNQKGIYPLSLKDLCTIDILPELIKAGIYSFKIEGRMKRPEYAAGVTSIYRKYIDAYLDNSIRPYKVENKDRQILLDLGNRGGFSKGYYMQKNGAQMITLKNPSYQSSEKKLLDSIRQKYIQKELKEKIKGVLRISKDNPMILELNCKGVTCQVQGALVQPAQNQPMPEEKIRKQMLKTGNTPFAFEELTIEMADTVFIPIQQLNELRRKGLDLLYDRLVEIYKRAYRKEIVLDSKKTGFQQEKILKGKQEIRNINVYIEKKEYFQIAVRKKEVTGIYIDMNVFDHSLELDQLDEYIEECHRNNKKCYLALPHIFREEQRNRFYEMKEFFQDSKVDGFLIKNLDEIGFLKHIESHKELILDYNMYTFNHLALDFWHQHSVIYDTIPLELNEKELKWRINNQSECIVYGYIPLMISAQCVSKTMSECKKSNRSEKTLLLKDRYQNNFLIKNQCTFCYNIIYNSKPLVLWDENEIEKLSVGSIRLHFTIEPVEQVEKVLDSYVELFYNKKKIIQEFCNDYTRGHFKRGVE